MAVPGQQRLLDTSSPACPHPTVVKPPWGRSEHVHDGGEVQKTMRFKDQSLMEEQTGGNPQSSAGAGACERETTASVLGGFSLGWRKGMVANHLLGRGCKSPSQGVAQS